MSNVTIISFFKKREIDRLLARMIIKREREKNHKVPYRNESKDIAEDYIKSIVRKYYNESMPLSLTK